MFGDWRFTLPLLITASLGTEETYRF